jgi:pyruvate formate lyase activating enzyme
MSVARVLEEILADRIFYDESKGGVTISGGEPLVQFEFLKGFLEACQSRGVHTAVDTCGFAPLEHLMAIVPLTDLFLYDLKFVDEASHREFTGVSNELILKNLAALAQTHRNVWLRIPIIPRVNDSTAELEAMARLAAELPGVRQVNLLPYHQTGIHKFARLGQPYRLGDIAPPTPEYLKAVAARFAALGLHAKVGG